MKEILQNDSLKPPTVGKLVEGVVLGQKNGILFLDLGPLGTGVIYGKEFYQSKEMLEKLKQGDKVLAKIVDVENEDGFIELSVSGAMRELDFDVLKKSKEEGEVLKVKISGANKGGLLCEISGIPAFLPVSQLSSKNYPKVENGDKTKILKELQKFVGKEMKVKILILSPEKKQIILSEAKEKEGREIEKLIGKEFEGEVIGVFSFGVLTNFGQYKGLIPELENEQREKLKIGDKIKVKVEKIEDEKILLSFLEKIS